MFCIEMIGGHRIVEELFYGCFKSDNCRNKGLECMKIYNTSGCGKRCGGGIADGYSEPLRPH